MKSSVQIGSVYHYQHHCGCGPCPGEFLTSGITIRSRQTRLDSAPRKHRPKWTSFTRLFRDFEAQGRLGSSWIRNQLHQNISLSIAGTQRVLFPQHPRRTSPVIGSNGAQIPIPTDTFANYLALAASKPLILPTCLALTSPTITGMLPYMHKAYLCQKPRVLARPLLDVSSMAES